MISLPLRFWVIILICIVTLLSHQTTTAHAQTTTDAPEINISGGLVWSADDSLIVVGTTAGLRLHDSTDLSVVGQLAAGETIHSLDTTTFDDLIAIGTGDGRVEIWDLDLQQQLFEIVVPPPERRRGPVYFLDLSTDGSLITAGMMGMPGRVWNAATGELILEIPAIVAFGMMWSPSSDKLVADIENGGVFGIWNIHGEFLTTLQDGAGIMPTEWSPDGNWIVGAYRDQLSVWSTDTGAIVFSADAIPRPRQGGIEAIAWHPTSRFFAIHLHQSERLTSLPAVVQIWSVENFRVVHELQGVQFLELGLRSIAWSHSGDRFAAVSGDGHLYVWDAETFELLNDYDGYDSRLPDR